MARNSLDDHFNSLWLGVLSVIHYITQISPQLGASGQGIWILCLKKYIYNVLSAVCFNLSLKEV